MESEKKDMILEPAVVPSDLQPQPPSKAASVHSAEQQLDTDKKYETIQTIKMMNDPMSATAQHTNLKLNTMEKTMSMMNSSLNLLANQEILREAATTSRKGVSANTKLGIIQLVLSVLLSAFGGLLLARNASLAMFGSGRFFSFRLNRRNFNFKLFLRYLGRNFRRRLWSIGINEC